MATSSRSSSGPGPGSRRLRRSELLWICSCVTSLSLALNQLVRNSLPQLLASNHTSTVCPRCEPLNVLSGSLHCLPDMSVRA